MGIEEPRDLAFGGRVTRLKAKGQFLPALFLTIRHR